MSTAFSQSLRSLQADRNRISLVVLVLAGLIFFGWLCWFFLSPFTLFEKGQIVQTSSDGVVVVTFPSSAQNQVQIGQTVRLHLTGVESSLFIPGRVVDVSQPVGGDQFSVVVFADMDSPNVAFLQDDQTGQAEVAVAQLSPAKLILRTIGLGSDTPPVSFDVAP